MTAWTPTMMATEPDEPYLHVSPEAMLHADHTFKPTSNAGSDAYRKGLCKVCCAVKHRPGGTECERCYNHRMSNLGAPIETEKT